MADHAHPFAVSLGKAELYKFRPYKSPEDKERVHDILMRHRVYLARASELNDPFDLSPRFQTGTREELIEAAEDLKRREPNAPVDLDYLSTCDLSAHFAGATKSARDRLQNGYPVFSLAGNNTHPLLWSHYAGGHTGVCIHFETALRAGWFGQAQQVTYVDERPLIPTTVRSVPEHELFARLALRKNKWWFYEEEFRWIRFPNTDFPRVTIEGQYARFRAAALAGITLGSRMRDQDVRDLTAIAVGHVPSLQVFQAIETDTFEFEFARIA